jgi:hypothetical protein
MFYGEFYSLFVNRDISNPITQRDISNPGWKELQLNLLNKYFDWRKDGDDLD